MNNEERKQWLDNLKVGDEVCYRVGSISFKNYVIKTIDKITPTRRFKIDDLQFDSSGREMGNTDKWQTTKELLPVTDEVRNAILKDKILSKISGFNFKTLNIEELKQIYTIITKSV
jgi:hypothetical protein